MTWPTLSEHHKKVSVRSLKQFKEQGCIEIDKRNIYIKDKNQLEQLLQVKID